MRIKYEIPMKLPSCANLREHWSARARRARNHRESGRWHTAVAIMGNPLPARMRITLTRIAPRRLDSDNVASAFKGLRDGIADALGIDDGSPRLEWQYQQGKGAEMVRVEIDGL